MQDKLEDWRKTVGQLDKDHNKEYKKLRAEIKKKSDASSRVQKKNKKNKNASEAQKAINAANDEVTKQYKILVSDRVLIRKQCVWGINWTEVIQGGY